MAKNLKFTKGKALYRHERVGTYERLPDGTWFVQDIRGHNKIYESEGEAVGHFIFFDWSSRIPSQNQDSRLSVIVKNKNMRKRFALT